MQGQILDIAANPQTGDSLMYRRQAAGQVVFACKDTLHHSKSSSDGQLQIDVR